MGPWWPLVALLVARVRTAGCLGLARSAGQCRALSTSGGACLLSTTPSAHRRGQLSRHTRAACVRALAAPSVPPRQRAACPAWRLHSCASGAGFGLQPMRRARVAQSARASGRERRQCLCMPSFAQCPGEPSARTLRGMRKPTRAARRRTRRASTVPTGERTRQPSNARRCGHALRFPSSNMPEQSCLDAGGLHGPQAGRPRRGRTLHGARATEPRRGRPTRPRAPKCQNCPLLTNPAQCPRAPNWCTLLGMNSPTHAARGRAHRAPVDSAGMRAPAPAARLQAR